MHHLCVSLFLDGWGRSNAGFVVEEFVILDVVKGSGQVGLSGALESELVDEESVLEGAGHSRLVGVLIF